MTLRFVRQITFLLVAVAVTGCGRAAEKPLAPRSVKSIPVELVIKSLRSRGFSVSKQPVLTPLDASELKNITLISNLDRGNSRAAHLLANQRMAVEGSVSCFVGNIDNKRGAELRFGSSAVGVTADLLDLSCYIDTTAQHVPADRVTEFRNAMRDIEGQVK